MPRQILVPAILISPLLGVALVPLKKAYRKTFFGLLLLIPILNVAALLSVGVQDVPFIMGSWFVFSLDRYSYLFGLLLNVCWATTILYSIDFVRYNFQANASIFYRNFSAAVAFIMATGLSGNLFTLFFFYLSSIPLIYPLVTLRNNRESLSAGRWYLLSTLGPAVGIALPALIFVDRWFAPFQEVSIRQVTSNDTVASLLLAALVVGFSKNCVAPFFTWLPKSSVAPAPVSGLMHSVGAVHTGTLAVLKVIVYLYGFDYMAKLSEEFFKAGWLIYLCGFTSLYTAVRAYRANDLKKRFSYSTVGQLSFVITASLIGTPRALAGATLHIVSHSLAKLTLFFAAGTFNSVYGTIDAKKISAIVPYTPWLALTVGIAGLSISGFPFLAGYYSKDLMLLEELSSHHYAAAVFLVLGSVLNFLYIFPVLTAAVTGDRQSNFLLKPIPSGMKYALMANTSLILLLSAYMMVRGLRF